MEVLLTVERRNLMYLRHISFHWLYLPLSSWPIDEASVKVLSDIWAAGCTPGCIILNGFWSKEGHADFKGRHKTFRFCHRRSHEIDIFANVYTFDLHNICHVCQRVVLCMYMCYINFYDWISIKLVRLCTLHVKHRPKKLYSAFVKY